MFINKIRSNNRCSMRMKSEDTNIRVIQIMTINSNISKWKHRSITSKEDRIVMMVMITRKLNQCVQCPRNIDKIKVICDILSYGLVFL